MTNLLPHYHWLASDAGSETVQAAAALRRRGWSDLRLGEWLRASIDAERAALVLTQLDLRVRAAAKFTQPEQMLFTRPGLEQSSSEVIARRRAQQFKAFGAVVDLCCGIGGDLLGLASVTEAQVAAVDLDPVHLFLAKHNAQAISGVTDIRTSLQDVREYPISRNEAVFIDPARRVESGKRIGYHSEPPLEWAIQVAEYAAGVAIKTAPGVPHELLPAGWEMEHIAIGKDLKEAVLWSPGILGFEHDEHRWPHRATVIVGNDVHTLPGSHIDVIEVTDPEPGMWLHDINPAVTNAGLVRDLAAEIDADLIDPEIGFLVTERAVENPFTTCWQVLAVLPWHEKRIRQTINALDIGPIDIRRRGLAGDVPAITKRLRGKGHRRAMIAMTRMRDEPTAIICAMD